VEPELELADQLAVVGGRVPFAILRVLEARGPSTTRQLTDVATPLGRSRQSSVEKTVKRLVGAGFVELAPITGIAHYRITTKGERLVLGVIFGSRGQPTALEGRRMVLVEGGGMAHATARSLLSVPVVTGLFETEGDFRYAAVCDDDLSVVRELEDQIREAGGAVRSLRFTALRGDSEPKKPGA
jgi:hypothetical protein